MTTVYGVTKFGAKYQIVRQLDDIPSFPKEHSWQGAIYLADKTFQCLQEMFTATKEIQVQLLILQMLRLLSAKAQGCKDFWKSSQPCHVGIHWRALAEYFQMSNHMLGFQ